MTEKYFEKFPLINYNNTLAVNITERATLLKGVYNNPTLYYQYDIRPYERPDNISDRYYQDEYMTWVLYLTNNIIDPYYGWYMDQDTFNEFIKKKYGTPEIAASKIKYYRNNWYNESDSITVDFYNNLDACQKPYYEPIYSDEYNATTLAYKRKQNDWTLATNMVARYDIASGNNFIIDEIVDVVFNVNSKGTGQVVSHTSNTLTLQHLSGVTTTGSITGSSYVYGRESNANQVFTAAVSLANNIPDLENGYWSAVTYYDYENEINEKNKSIRVLDSRYSSQAASELKSILS